MEYCYVVTCDSLNDPETSVTRISGACYHDFDNAVRFVENRSDKPKKVYGNSFVWLGERWIYTIHTLTFDD